MIVSIPNNITVDAYKYFRSGVQTVVFEEWSKEMSSFSNSTSLLTHRCFEKLNIKCMQWNKILAGETNNLVQSDKWITGDMARFTRSISVTLLAIAVPFWGCSWNWWLVNEWVLCEVHNYEKTCTVYCELIFIHFTSSELHKITYFCRNTNSL